MRLFIAEKPELAKAITTGLSGTVQREDRYFKVGDNLVTWAYGHILGLAMPEDYNEKFKTYQEASNHISELSKSVKDVDLDDVKVKLYNKR